MTTKTNSDSLLVYRLLASMTLILGAHISLVNTILPKIYSQSKYWIVDLFFLLITAFGIIILMRLQKKKPMKFLNYYFLYTGLKLSLSMALLLPWLLTKDEFTRPMVYQFMILFFAFLFVETFALVRLLNK